MNKQDFLALVRRQIEGLPPEDRDKALTFYGEMIDDRIEEGMTEEQAVSALGSVDEIAAQIFADAPQAVPVSTALRSRRLSTGERLLLIFSSPVWAPLLLAAALIVLAVYIVLWSAVVVLYAADLSLAAGCLAGVGGGVVLASVGQPVQALLFMGAGLVCAGLAVFLFFGCNAAAAGTAKLGGLCLRRIVSRGKRKEETA